MTESTEIEKKNTTHNIQIKMNKHFFQDNNMQTKEKRQSVWNEIYKTTV